METLPVLESDPRAFGGIVSFTPVEAAAVSSMVPPEAGVIGDDLVFIVQFASADKAIFLSISELSETVMSVLVLPTLYESSVYPSAPAEIFQSPAITPNS